MYPVYDENNEPIISMCKIWWNEILREKLQTACE
jgi:hypothetical protein